MSAECPTDHHPKPHQHHQHPDPLQRPKAIKRLKIVLSIAICLIAIEVVGSWVSGSLALLADAVHVLADSTGLGVTLLATWLATRPESPKRSYGYYRLEVLAALLNSILLLGMALFIFQAAYERWNEVREIHATTMLGVAILGLLVNLLMLFILKPAHSHNLNLRGAYLHVLGDTLSSVAVITGAFLIFLTGMVWIDCLASTVVATIITFLAIRLAWDSINVLLEATPKHMNPKEIEMTLKATCPQISDIHDFHVWEITAHLFAMTAHIRAYIKTLEDSEELINKMNEVIRQKYGIGHTTFQVEPKSKAN